MYKIPKTWIYYSTVMLVFILFKAWYSFVLEKENFHFLLWPTSVLLSFIKGADFTYVPGEGYWFQSLNMVVNDACSGFDYWMILFLVFAFKAGSHLKNNLGLTLAIPLSFLSAYVATIFVNSARIQFILLCNRFFPNNAKPDWAHEAEGIFIFFSFLIIAYYVVHYIFKQWQKLEESEEVDTNS